MSVGLKIKGQYLDLGESTTTAVERNTPLLLGDEILGEYTFPRLIPATGKNIRLLGFLNELGTIKTVELVKIHDAEYEEYGLLIFRGTLVAEFTQIDLNFPESGMISVYFLAAISSFYSMAQNVTLQQLDLGGTRTIFNFIEHATSTLSGTSETYDYTFSPVYNSKFIPVEESPGYVLDRFMNPTTVLGGILHLDVLVGERCVTPFIYYRYLLIKCFSHFGYTISGDLLDDPDFKKAFCLSFKAINWVHRTGPFGLPEAMNPVSFNLINHVPRNYTITKFLIGVANLFAIAYYIDPISKHCQIIQLNKLMEKSNRKDMSEKVASSIKSEIAKQQKKYALKFLFDSQDGKISKPDFKGLQYWGQVNTVDNLPAANSSFNNFYALIKFTNWYYICQYDEDLNDYMWNFLSDNIYDYEPDATTDSIETYITPVCQSMARWKIISPTNTAKALFPHVEQEGNWDGKFGEFINWDMRILFNHGLKQDPQGNTYPYSSSHNYTLSGVKIARFSLSHNLPAEGLLQEFWSRWLKILEGMETIEFVLNLNMGEYRHLNWTDIILIRNCAYLLIQQSPDSPYPDRLPCKAIKINPSNSI